MSGVSVERGSELWNTIETNNTEFSRCFAAADWKALADLYTDDCIVAPTGPPFPPGKKSVEIVFSGAWNAGVRQLLLYSDTVVPGGDNTVAEKGEYRMIREDGSRFDTGKYVVTWRLVGDKWFIVWDIWNSNTAPNSSA